METLALTEGMMVELSGCFDLGLILQWQERLVDRRVIIRVEINSTAITLEQAFYRARFWLPL